MTINSTKVNPVREFRLPTVCADGGIEPPSALKLVDQRLKLAVFSNGVNAFLFFIIEK
ncbi:MAG: hypothetical protein P9M12_04465 [Candidatus Aceula lacicola]|nr:hypothetical protein [Candidatus Aceula lacicola]